MIRFLLLLGLFSVTAPAAPDTVVLDTGAILHGLILGHDPLGVQFSTQNHSTYRIPWAKVSCLQYGVTAENTAPNGRKPGPVTDAGPAAPPPLAASESLHFPLGPTATLVASHGPEFPNRVWRAGPLVGLSGANVSLSPDFSTSSRTGLVAGGFVEWRFSRLFALEPELQYAQLGYRVVADDVSVLTRYDVLNVPVLLKLRLDPGRPDLRFFLLAGPSLGFRLHASRTGAGQDADLSSALASTALAFVIGGGAEYALSPRVALRVDARYSFGLNNLSRVSGSLRTSDTFFLVGLSFAL